MSQAISVCIADDHDIIRQALQMVLGETEDIVVVNEATTGIEALEFCRQENPDVLILDNHMPGMNGLSAAERILRQSSTKIIFLTSQEKGPLPRLVLEMGVLGFLSKTSAVSEIANAVRQVYSGEKYLSQPIAELLAKQFIGDIKDERFDDLSRRELEVLQLMARGKRNIEIAELLHVSPKTISTYCTRMRDKVDASNNAELIKLAIANEVVTPN
ncbi:MAG: response regulator transcription factor [Gammaproteobacteria bacterium]|nr:response regulator transcription factor [Gammaproteobacteria bacterium]NNC98077.1 response regulator transcription factor [Gammaproteobacteria bacterium]NNM13141.1 response regulator transcription factor [Gammaproteobacteria bacterium]